MHWSKKRFDSPGSAHSNDSSSESLTDQRDAVIGNGIAPKLKLSANTRDV